MKGFIEVTNVRYENKSILINIDHIQEVIGNTIYLDFCEPNSCEQDHVDCLEGYAEICKKISEAQ